MQSSFTRLHAPIIFLNHSNICRLFPQRTASQSLRSRVFDSRCTASTSSPDAVGIELSEHTPRRGSCYGCGAALQTEEAAAPGYVSVEKYEEKRRHRQLGTLVCRRCQDLSNGAMVPGVADVWGRDSEEDLKVLVSPEQLRTQLARVREERAVAVLLVDLLDASGSFLSRVRDLIGKNPVFLVGTKVDLLPKGTNTEEVAQWLERSAAQKRLSPIATFLVSSRTREGIAQVAKAVRIERRGRDVYIMGSANVGKSAFVRCAECQIIVLEPAIGIAGHLPVESAMPGTTLQLIALNTFEAGGTLFDTPGVHLQHRLQHLLEPALTKQLLPKGKLKPFLPPSPQELAFQAQLGTSSPTSYFWGGLVRIDIVDAPVSTSLAFYGPRTMRVTSSPLLDDSSDHLSAVSAKSADVTLNLSGAGPVADVAVSGLPGWVAIRTEQNGGRLVLRVWAPAGIEAYVRPPLPVPQIVK
ncbi:hypothetical protein COCSUDRAFT_26953 [Coccomyxa subellipsoidea C-169]|uniref:G domain-containing protein n=1 Tax=Coccomyxa subellipsoidea (strain C-169) TaxID=574566 RepID=I0Z6M6_COCSC|nr:hypothetical protein COCSUDRAFT_26953 [Coccomyxa subellipsoidea C-169]EIE26295.1 hypothetical protein COCSUDRAFT_26953 [Coccomyxa subellipsoidea C-169]|eukprot:XP_005650839.1 hypothetical protein COCSUDRAFT_26953 [Coccomyxa subellipsoidea C-169]